MALKNFTKFNNKLFLEHIDKISNILNLDKNVLIFYIFNRGKIENIINGLKIDKISKNKFNLTISENIQLKKNIIKDNILYNFSHYFVLNNFKKVSCNHPNLRDIWNTNSTLFERKIKIDNVSVEVGLWVQCNDSNDLVEEGFSLEWLKENDKKSFDDLEDHLYNIIPVEEVGNYHFVSLNITTLTNSLDKNMLIIENSLKTSYKWYIEELERIKKHNRKYFKKQLIQKNVNNF